MPTDNRNIRREFSYTRPILYAGESYPSADSTISDESGNETKGRIFTDANGQYYTLGANGFPIPVMSKEMLDEVTVSAPRDRESLFKNYLLGRNDNTQVTNLPHREYNSNLTEAGLIGAAHHAAWDKEHPNLSAWRDAATAVPFAVAAAPAVIGGGQAALGTSLSQAALGLGSRVMANPIVDAANTALGLGFAAKGAYDVSQGEFTPQTAMDLAGGTTLLAKGTGLFDKFLKAGKSVGNKEPTFVSELDWSPENWFKNRIGGNGYGAEDAAALKSHIPEYHKIEKEAKANGTWLKMPDGSTWEGDPRSWVQLMSKNGSKLQKRIMYHGDSDYYTWDNGEDITPTTIGSKILWTSNNKHLPVTYGSNHYQLTIPNETPNVVFDADGRYWNNLSAPSSYKYHNTNDVSLDLLKDDNTVNINNVVDVGPDARWSTGKNGLPEPIPGEKLYDYQDRVFKGDDIILGRDVPRKSLLGNNGNFDLSNKNIYKGLIPFALYNFASQKNQ